MQCGVQPGGRAIINQAHRRPETQIAFSWRHLKQPASSSSSSHLAKPSSTAHPTRILSPRDTSPGMSTTVTIHPTMPSGACPFADLPHELMTEAFLHLDPHTLYTSIRQLNRDWKETVESHIIPMAFKSGKWRLALRIHQRPRKYTLEQQAQIDSALATSRESDDERRQRVESTRGAWEDELLPPSKEPRVITTYLPLQLDRVNSSSDRFEFSTGNNWYALYEIDPTTNNQEDHSFRLSLDFGVAWRFDGDGKDGEEQRPGGWTKLDQENGWLSKFYCSTYDLGRSNRNTHSDKETYQLHATPLTRRRRMPAGRPSQPGGPVPLQWDDEHIEYLHLRLSLGTEFFIRRSARANLLMRALEAEAARIDELAAMEDGRSASTLAPPSPRIQRPLAQRAALAAHTNRHASGTAPPPASRNSPPNQLNSDLSPAEQLQLMAKSKAAAKAAGRDAAASSRRLPGWARYHDKAGTKSSNGNASPMNRTVSQPVSRNRSQPSSLAPSRVVSRAPTRPGSPNAEAASEALEELTVAGSEGGSRFNTSRLNTPAMPGTPVHSPRDMPHFRAQALSLSTASPFTHRALSGYTTPNTATGTNSFSLRGGGGAEPGGTPMAEFTGILRRAAGFQPARDPRSARERAASVSSIITLTPEGADTTASAGPSSSSSAHKWIKTQEPKVDGEGITREWKWSQLAEPDGNRYEGQTIESDWSWSR